MGFTFNFRTIEALNFFYQLSFACFPFAECGGHCLYVS